MKLTLRLCSVLLNQCSKVDTSDVTHQACSQQKYGLASKISNYGTCSLHPVMYPMAVSEITPYLPFTFSHCTDSTGTSFATSRAVSGSHDNILLKPFMVLKG